MNTKFHKLLQELNIDYLPSEFTNHASISVLNIYKNDKIWDFIFEFPYPLNANDLSDFICKMTTILPNKYACGKISYKINYNSDIKDKEFLIESYFPKIIDILSEDRVSIVGLKTAVNDNTYEVRKNTLNLFVRDYNDKVLLEEQYKDIIESEFDKIGFKTIFMPIININGKSTQEKIEKFSEETREKYHKEYEEAKENTSTNDKKETRSPANKRQYNSKPVNVSDSVISREIKGNSVPIKNIPVSEYELQENDRFVFEGEIFDSEARELKNGELILYQVKVTDYTDSIVVKYFLKTVSKKDEVGKIFKKGNKIKVAGKAQYDTFARDITIMAYAVNLLPSDEKKERIDEGYNGKRRVELHLHTNMSAMDGVATMKEYVGTAVKWGHTAIALTDHVNVHAIPELANATRGKDIKPIFGVEANLVDDLKIVYNDKHILLNEATYVVYDLETTGFSVRDDEIIEIAAVKIVNGQIIDEYSTYVNPRRKLNLKTVEITNITDDALFGAPTIDEIINDFKNWIGDAILVAHNAMFDIGHLNEAYIKHGLGEVTNPVIDTLQIARAFYNDKLKRFNLKAVSKYFKAELTMHHRAIYDAKATGEVFLHMLKELLQKGIKFHDEINSYIDRDEGYKFTIPRHCSILAMNDVGLKNLFKIVSHAHTTRFHKEPRFLRRDIETYREGLLLGSGCVNGEVFETALNKNYAELLEKARYYDYLEVQPPSVYSYLKYTTGQGDMDRRIKDTIKLIIKAGKELGIPVVATSDAHHLNPEDKLYRKIYTKTPAIGGGLHPLGSSAIEDIPSQHFRTTNEMMREFEFLGMDIAEEIVVTNTNMIADRVDSLQAIKDKLFTPSDKFLKEKGIESINVKMREMCIDRAKSIYGDEIPKYVEDRLEKELNSIIGHGFAVVYYISHMLVKKSLDDGFLVGSRGSVGSSFVATMMDITEVNPLAPHYHCLECKYSVFKMTEEEKNLYGIRDIDEEFQSILTSVDSGFDLPDHNCPVCGKKLEKDGHDIPFETFLGFKGDKVPDIDLNFSGEYQPVAHNYCKEVFGEDYVYRAGTISTVAEKTAFGYVRGYFERIGEERRNAEIERIAKHCVGVKRTTGQHPGGIIVVPNYMDIFDISPIQYPPEGVSSEWRTTHFDFHSIHDNLLKLDILGHDDPTVLRYLQDITGIAPKDVPVDDEDVYKLFCSTESLKVTPEEIKSDVGTLGVPEFGTNFVSQMLVETRPNTFAELVKISGLSHGKDVWLNNAQELVSKKTCEFKDVIGCRDDIMVYLLYQGLDPSDAFQITEFVRKGKPSIEKEKWEEYKKIMRTKDVPEWYIWSCGQIKYMFPKAHATAYVLMAIRIAWFKVHMPIYYYSAYFSKRASFFDVGVMAKGYQAIKNKLEEIVEKGNEASTAEKNLYTVLELALEMTARGFTFKQIDIEKSDSKNFLICDDGKSLIIPFIAMDGLGDNVANSILQAREEKSFISIDDAIQRTQLSKTLIERLGYLGSLGDLPQNSQISLF